MNTGADALPALVLVLASSSPRRQQLIGTIGLPVHVCPSNADEGTPSDWSPSRIVEELSLRKSEAVLNEARAVPAERRIIVGSDTIVVLDGDVLGKPSDAPEARDMLTRLAGRSHDVYTGVTCLDAGSGQVVTAHRITRVYMRELSTDQINRYIATGEPMDKAGAYGIQDYGALLIDRIEGDYFNVVGLPLSLLARQLESFGIVRP